MQRKQYNQQRLNMRLLRTETLSGAFFFSGLSTYYTACHTVAVQQIKVFRK